MKKTTTIFKTLIVGLFLLSMTGRAQIFSTVGSGTTYNSTFTYPAPYGNYYWFSKHQFYVSPAELIAAGVAPGAQIMSIGFNNFSNNTLSYVTQWAYAVYGTTSTDPLATGMVTTGQLSNGGPPLSGNFTPALGWNTHTLTPFIWNGSDGLVVETCHAHNANWSSNASTYWETSLTGSSTKSRWFYQDNVTACQNSGSQGTSTTTRPNIRFEWISPTPCSGAPAPNSVVGPTFAICPNAPAQLSFANSYTLGGLSYLWYASTTSSLGPWTAVTGTMPVVSVPNLTTSSYIMAVATCSAGGTTSLSAFQVSVQPIVTSTVPYFESFEGINEPNTLPNCSWAASGLGNGQPCQTYTASNTQNRMPRTGSKFASFYYQPSGDNYFYTNGIQLNAGVTYSAEVWYTTEYIGYNNWTDLSIMLGTSQSTTGLITIASTNGPAISNVYKKLSNTFSVATSGIYYVAIKTTVNNSSFANYLSWDDLSITIPCTPESGNNPAVAISTATNVICAGETANLTSTGADSYQWNNGSTSNIVAEELFYTTTYQVVGTNTVTGCTNSSSQVIVVNPTPNIYLFTNKTAVCAGQSAVLTAVGGVSYLWSGNPTNNSNTNVVTPNATTSYSVQGFNSFGCSKLAVQSIVVNPLPNVSVSSASPVKICKGEPVVLTALGGATYSWTSSNSPVVLNGGAVTVAPLVTATYSVTGTDINGCSNVATVLQNVEECLGISAAFAAAGINVYPNPSSGEFIIEGAAGTYVEVTDLTGKVIYTNRLNDTSVTVNLSNASNGVYFLKVQTQAAVNTVKLIKQ